MSVFVFYLRLCAAFLIAIVLLTLHFNKMNSPQLLLMHVCLIHRAHWLDQEWRIFTPYGLRFTSQVTGNKWRQLSVLLRWTGQTSGVAHLLRKVLSFWCVCGCKIDADCTLFFWETPSLTWRAVYHHHHHHHHRACKPLDLAARSDLNATVHMSL